MNLVAANRYSELLQFSDLNFASCFIYLIIHLFGVLAHFLFSPSRLYSILVSTAWRHIMVEKFHASGRLVLCCSLAISGALAILPAAASAGGFFIQEQSVAHQGASFAGVVSEPGDASTIFFNPAGLTKLDGAQAVSGGTLIVPRLRFNDTGSAVTTPGTPGTVGNSGGAGGNPFDPALVPNIGAATPALDGRLWFGLGVNSPFGLKTEYADGWIGRYDSTSSELLTIDVAPTVAFQATDYLSIGGGVQFSIWPCDAGERHSRSYGSPAQCCDRRQGGARGRRLGCRIQCRAPV